MPFFSRNNSNGDQGTYYSWTPSDVGLSGTSIVFIHGLGSSHSFFAPVIPSLVEEGYSCLSFDSPGSALSPEHKSNISAIDIAQCAQFLMYHLELNSKRTFIVGHSMGAIVACELALQLQTAGVILLGPVHPNDNLADIFQDRITKVRQGGLEVLADTIPEKATGSRATSTQKAFIRSLILSQRPSGYMSHCQLIATAKPPKYGKLSCPLLVVGGSEDLTSPLENCVEILQSWGTESNKSSTIIEGCGHWHCIEAAEEVSKCISGFIARFSYIKDA